MKLFILFTAVLCCFAATKCLECEDKPEETILTCGHCGNNRCNGC